MNEFIIVAPGYMETSNGIKTMHKICHSINSIGGKAKMAFIDSNDPNTTTVSLRDASWTNKAWNTPVLQESERRLLDTAYVVYPEVMVGNPFNAKKIIRYFGNRETYCNGKMIGIGPNDFLLAHARATRKDAHCILFNSEVNPAFHAEGARPVNQRTLNATYIGKGYLYGKVGMVEKTLLVGRDWPASQEQLAMLLREIRIFYTWDSWTSTNVEAILCGAVPFYLRYEPWTEEDIDGTDLGPIPRMDEKHKNFDAVKFEEDRMRLRKNIDTIAATWNDRVKTFMDMAEQHFIQRGEKAA